MDHVGARIATSPMRGRPIGSKCQKFDRQTQDEGGIVGESGE